MNAESGVTDEQARVRRFQHEVEPGFARQEFGFDMVPVAENQASKGDGCTGTAIGGQGPDLRGWYPGNQQDAADWSVTGDPEGGKELEFLAFGFDDGD